MQAKHLSSMLVLGAVGVTLGCGVQPTTVNKTVHPDSTRAIAQAAQEQQQEEEANPEQMAGALEEPAEAEEPATSPEAAPNTAPNAMTTQSRSVQQWPARRTWARGTWGPRGRWVGGGWAGNTWYGRRFWRNQWWDPWNVGNRVVFRPIRPVPPIGAVPLPIGG